MSQDRQIQEAVLADSAWEPRVTPAHIGVTAKNGTVTLTGHLENFPENRAAEHAAARVKGVKAVVELLKVELQPNMMRNDEDIATQLSPGSTGKSASRAMSSKLRSRTAG